MSWTPLFRDRWIYPVVTGVVLVALACFAAAAHAADPPIGTVGVTSPGGSQTASGTVVSGGQTDACVNDQHSGVSPATGQNGGVQVNDSACAASGGASPPGSGGAQASAGGQSTSSTGSAGGVPGAATTSGSASRTWVSATGARGLRIVRVQYFVNDVAATKRLRMVVSLRDLNGRRVRHAIVSAGPVTGAKRTVGGTTSTFSNRLGQARLVVPATTSMLGRRLLLRITARTPSVRVVTVGSVLLPRVAPG
jgi:hypothetical protein